MKKLHHPNIIELYAVCTKKPGPIYIVTELMKHGSLLEYLCGEGRSTNLPQLINMASQVAAGMAYLEERNIIHRDLSAKNILVGEYLLCKVANFEMARVVNKGGVHTPPTLSGEKIATKWVAPEIFTHDIVRFSIKSDVWSFGIVLYEIITHGHVPYPGMNNAQVRKQIAQGYRMSQPEGCPNQLYNIMLHCWREEPANRPRFETLQWQLEELEDSGLYR